MDVVDFEKKKKRKGKKVFICSFFSELRYFRARPLSGGKEQEKFEAISRLFPPPPPPPPPPFPWFLLPLPTLKFPELFFKCFERKKA